MSGMAPVRPAGQSVKPWETSRPTSAGAHTIDSTHPKVDFGTTKPTELGQIGEKLTKQDLTDRGYNVIGEQPQIRYTDPVTGADKWFKPDFVAVDPAGKVVLVESKMGDGAKEKVPAGLIISADDLPPEPVKIDINDPAAMREALKGQLPEGVDFEFEEINDDEYDRIMREASQAADQAEAQSTEPAVVDEHDEL